MSATELEAAGAWPTLRELLATPSSLRRMLLAYCQSTLGDSVGYIALLLVSYQRLHSSWAITAVLLADLGPRIIFGPLAGELADRLTRRVCLVGADLVRGCALVGVALASSFLATIGFALLVGCASAVYRPLASAALPTLAGRDQVKGAVAARAAIGNTAETVGWAVAAGLLAVGTPKFLLILDAATFLVNAGVICTLRLERAARSSADYPRRLRELTRSSVSAVRQVPGLSALLLTATAVLVSAGMIGVAEPLLARAVLHAGDVGFALLAAAFGLGLVAGSYRSAAAGTVELLRHGYLGALVVAAFGLLVLAAAPVLAVALVGCTITGAGNALALAREEQIIQVTVPDELLETVFGVREATHGLALGSSFVVGGALAAALGARAIYAAAAAGVLGAACAGLMLVRRRVAR
jgi:MFS family permease